MAFFPEKVQNIILQKAESEYNEVIALLLRCL